MSDTPARRLLVEYARRSGLLASDVVPTRYLWTDAFAVCGFLGLYESEDDPEALDLARRLVDQTHEVLGRHRPDDARSGFISGLSDAEGARRPTAGGLRIGKPLPERSADTPLDERLEWDRDGQYFHYLTRWMHALCRMAAVTQDARYHREACELARAAWAGFTRTTRDGTRRLFWKMSIDLSRPLVASTGHHDPLDGLVTYSRLQSFEKPEPRLDLDDAIRGLAAMCAGRSWHTDDSLGIGGLLCDAYWLASLAGRCPTIEATLLGDVLEAALYGLQSVVAHEDFRTAADRRLAFRELGLSIGLHAVERIELPLSHDSEAARVRALTDRLRRFVPWANRIERFWLEPGSRGASTWIGHRDINEVMLAASLAPDGYLGAATAGRVRT